MKLFKTSAGPVKVGDVLNIKNGEFMTVSGFDDTGWIIAEDEKGQSFFVHPDHVESIRLFIS